MLNKVISGHELRPGTTVKDHIHVEGSEAEWLAHMLFEVFINNADYYIDLHLYAVNPACLICTSTSIRVNPRCCKCGSLHII